MLKLLKLPFKLVWFLFFILLLPFKLIIGGYKSSKSPLDKSIKYFKNKNKNIVMPYLPIITAIIKGCTISNLRHIIKNNLKPDFSHTRYNSQLIGETCDLKSGTVTFNREYGFKFII